ncbi:ArgS-related anticodon-binding protein NrtL [Streptomyces sp. NPDC004838]
MTPAELSRTVLHVVCRAVADGALAVPVPESVGVERPRPGGRGDYATNVALRLAAAAGQPPRAVAETLRERIGREPGIASIEITGPGFLNITLEQGARQKLVRRVLEQGLRYGHVPYGPEHPVAPLRAHRVGAHAGANRPSAPPAADSPACGTRGRIWDLTVSRLRRVRGMDATGGPPYPAPVPGPAHPPHLGPDPVRWAYLSVAAHDRVRLGAHLLVQRESNPLFQVRYAYSRTRALTRNAALLGFTSGSAEDAGRAEGAGADSATAGQGTQRVEAERAKTNDAGTEYDAGTQHVEAGLTRLTHLIADYPEALASAARLGAPDRVARHLESTADVLLGFQHTVLPSGGEKPTAAHRSRLAVAEAAGTVLAGGLSLLGVSAPEYL